MEILYRRPICHGKLYLYESAVKKKNENICKYFQQSQPHIYVVHTVGGCPQAPPSTEKPGKQFLPNYLSPCSNVNTELKKQMYDWEAGRIISHTNHTIQCHHISTFDSLLPGPICTNTWFIKSWNATTWKIYQILFWRGKQGCGSCAVNTERGWKERDFSSSALFWSVTGLLKSFAMSWFVTYWQKTLMTRAHKTIQTESSDKQQNVFFSWHWMQLWHHQWHWCQWWR